MNYQHQENGARTGPLIFSVPAYGFVMALYLDWLGGPHRAVWLLPTPEFRRAALEHRGSLWTIAGQTSDPERALANLLERDHLFTERLAAQVRRLDLPAIAVDPSMTEDDLAVRVAASFAF